MSSALFLALLSALWVVPIIKAAGTETKARPNFIFVLIDDMGYADLSCYGGKENVSPRIDSLAREGIRFSQFYVGSPICSPSRTAFTTGQFPARWGITSFLASRRENDNRGMPHWLDPQAPSLARVLQKAGYATGHFGKWHMGGQRDVGEAPLIKEYGFDRSFTQFEGLGDRILPLCDAFDGKPPRKHALGSDNLGRGAIEWMDRSRITGAFVKQALRFIEQAQRDGKPFYVNVWPDDVHSPFFPPKDLRGDGSKRDLYLGVLRAMDEQLGPLFDLVRQTPSLRTNTWILVSSDNGPEPGAGLAGRFRGTKGMLYEGGIRSPLIVWGPGFMDEKASGTWNETTVLSAVDFLPTISGLGRAALPRDLRLDGQEMGAAFRGQKMDRSKPLFWVRPPDRPGPSSEPLPDLAVRDGRWKLLMMRDAKVLALYDLANDPGENHNLAAEQPGIVSDLRERLMVFEKSLTPKAAAPQSKVFPSPAE